jgi:LPXTG-site transpeptidase (sortase) family protein
VTKMTARSSTACSCRQRTPNTVTAIGSPGARRPWLVGVVLTLTATLTGIGARSAGVAEAIGSGQGVVPLGTISSPALGQPIPVFEGVPADTAMLIKPSSLNVPGAVHLPQSVLPGGLGVAVVAAHRTTWPRPFYNLEKLAVGERLTYTAASGRQTTYQIVETAVLPNNAAAFSRVMNNEVRYGSDSRLTLYACSRANGRPTSGTYRLVVFAINVGTAEQRR